MVQASFLQKPVYVLFFLFLAIAGLYFAKPFLVPLCFGGLLSMLFLPVSLWLQKKGFGKGLSIVTCIILFVAVIAALIWLITWQITDLTSDLSNIEQKITRMIENLRQFVNKKFGISPKQQEQLLNNSKGSAGGVSSMASNIGSGIMRFLVDFVLVLVYIFLLMYFRGHIKKFILQLVPAKEKGNAEEIISGIKKSITTISYRFGANDCRLVDYVWHWLFDCWRSIRYIFCYSLRSAGDSSFRW